MERNAPKHEFRVQWCGSGAFVVKTLLQDIVARTFALIAPVWRVLQQVFCYKEPVPNAPKRKETNQNMSLGSNGADRERSLREIVTRHHGTNFSINCTSVTCFVSSFV